MIRILTPSDHIEALAIINDASQAYKGVIPDDRWHEPYFSAQDLEQALREGVVFYGLELDGRLLAVMGIQDKGDVALIRHAYVRSRERGKGLGSQLLRHLAASEKRPVLIGTWAAADWAIRFYKQHGYRLVSPWEKDRLLARYWGVPARQVETSVVLADARWWAGQKAHPDDGERA
jgi:GNAT superfamily N-acetyltransferase